MKYGRIYNLRTDHDLTIKTLSAEIDLHRDVYARYEKGFRDVPTDVLIKLADYYNVSVDYLLGRTDKKEVNR